jgi:uncharacterized YigZ family protein
MIEQYQTLASSAGPVEYKEKGSRFLGYAGPLDSVEAVENTITGLRKKYYDATHVCLAYRLGEGAEREFRYSDDGEPSGTAGLPIYHELVRLSLHNVWAAVVRYYGGVKLGTGGLTRAYSATARIVLETIPLRTVYLKHQVTIRIGFPFLGAMMHLIDLFGIEILAQEYTAEGVTLQLAVLVGKWEPFRLALLEKSAGKLLI